ncbi:hypothetical protein CsSME_00003183 [Camellia sinensis var. sinensis]
MEGVVQCSANYVPLSPINFLERAAFVYGDQVSIVHGNTTYSWRQTHQRCIKLASALSQLGISRGGVVAALAPNIPELCELYFGVPMAGAVISTLNTRLDAPMIGSLLEELEAKIICIDYQFLELVLKALDFLSLSNSKAKPPLIVVIPECNHTTTNLPPSSLDYNRLLEMGQNDFEILHPIDKCQPISVNYTTGSTGKPKGAVYSHRAVYLNSLAEIFRSNMRAMPVFLWTVDMFHCSGWCFTWAVAALGGTNICIRNVTSKVIFDAIRLHRVTHLCSAPTILNMIAEAGSNDQQPLPSKVDVIITGALPPLQTLNKLRELGFNVSHAFGMTEALGPVISVPLDNDHGMMGVDNPSFLSKFIDMLMLDSGDPSDWTKYRQKIEVSRKGLLKLDHDTKLKVLRKFIKNSHVDLYRLTMSELHNSTHKPLSDDDHHHTHSVSIGREGSKKNGVVSSCSDGERSPFGKSVVIPKGKRLQRCNKKSSVTVPVNHMSEAEATMTKKPMKIRCKLKPPDKSFVSKRRLGDGDYGDDEEKVRRKKKRMIVKAPAVPPELPAEFKNHIECLNGTELNFVIEKPL